MTTQPEALRLADRAVSARDLAWHGEASTELRRLHEENERLRVDGIHSCHAECQRPVCRLTRERGALLEALINLLDNIHDTERDDGIVQAVEQARAAIKTVEEGK